MAFVDMYSELQGLVPMFPEDYAPTLINRAILDIYRRNLWSWLLWEGNWTSPNPITSGNAAATQTSNVVYLDATASAAVASQLTVGPGSPTPLTQRQFRAGNLGTIYNIWAYTLNTTGFNEGGFGEGGFGGTPQVSLTLDRPFAEASYTGAFTVYQCYYPAPIPDFRGWISVRDMTNFIDLFTNKSREDLDREDPQRSWYYFPTDVVPYQKDMNPASPTRGYQMFELWGQPSGMLTYQLYGFRKGLPLVNDSDTLPLGLGEDCVIERAKQFVYEWAEANSNDVPRNSRADFKFLIAKCDREYKELFKQYRKDDWEIANNYITSRRMGWGYGKIMAYYNTVNGTAFPGVGWGG